MEDLVQFCNVNEKTNLVEIEKTIFLFVFLFLQDENELAKHLYKLTPSIFLRWK